MFATFTEALYAARGMTGEELSELDEYLLVVWPGLVQWRTNPQGLERSPWAGPTARRDEALELWPDGGQG
jgi:hypothetical protein